MTEPTKTTRKRRSVDPALALIRRKTRDKVPEMEAVVADAAGALLEADDPAVWLEAMARIELVASLQCVDVTSHRRFVASAAELLKSLRVAEQDEASQRLRVLWERITGEPLTDASYRRLARGASQ